ncbi:MAG: hypothetical protein ACXVBW_08255 [Bdellovibrionota bacterium]
MNRSMIARLLPLCLFSSLALANGTTAFVTPTTQILTMTGLSLIDVSATSKTIFTGTQTLTFNRADTDFAAVSLPSVTIPFGRYVAAKLAFNGIKQIKISGNKLTTTSNTGGFNAGVQVTSVGAAGSDGTASSSVSVSAGTGNLINYTWQAGGNATQTTYFSGVYCIDSSQSNCKSTDTFVNSASVALYLMMDLYNSVPVDGSVGALDNHAVTLPIVTIGKPGAAIHMSSNGSLNGSNGTELSFVFDSNGKLINIPISNTSAATSFCTGNGNAGNVTAGPSGVTIPTADASGSNMMFVATTTSAGTGTIQYVAAGPNPGQSGGTRGIQNVTGWKQSVDQTVSIQCIADSAGTPAGLGYTYPTGTGSAGGTTTLTIVRIVDPGNVLGTCTSSSPGYVSGSSGVCASPTIATASDHYL